MKYQLYSLLCSSALFFASCEDKMDEKHTNPDGFTDTKIEYLYSRGALNALEIDYVDCYNLNIRLLATYTQVASRREGEDRINTYDIQNDKSRWENYYVKRMSTLTEIDKIYRSLSQKEQTEYLPYFETAKVLKAFNTAMATDFFGDMPYSEAFTARNTIFGEAVVLNPKYDTQKEIYYAILDDLKSAATYLKTASLDDKIDVQSAFKRQDIIYGGDLNKWYKFANSLLLRYAMRISNVDPAKTQTVLSGLAVTDLITANADNAYIKVSGKDTAPDAIWRAMRESHSKNNGYYCFAPELMTNLLNAAADPRIKVLFQTGSDDDGDVLDKTRTDFIPYPSSADDAIDLKKVETADEIMQKYAVYNTTTFRNNYYLPVGIGITAADVYFLLAEAQQRGLVSLGNAKDFYDKGIIASVQNYYDYYVNSTETDNKDAAVVATDITDAALAAWLEGSTFKFDPANALEQIATQKWMHTGILQIYETWAEYRRTDFPVLLDDKEKGALLNKENAPKRFLYPSKEASMNTDNYNSVSEQNYPEKNLWWDVK